MGDARALEAIRRIERAFARIDAASSRPIETSVPDASDDYRRLLGAHEALRRRVAGAIGQLDRLIEAGEER